MLCSDLECVKLQDAWTTLAIVSLFLTCCLQNFGHSLMAMALLCSRPLFVRCFTRKESEKNYPLFPESVRKHLAIF